MCVFACSLRVPFVVVSFCVACLLFVFVLVFVCCDCPFPLFYCRVLGFCVCVVCLVVCVCLCVTCFLSVFV